MSARAVALASTALVVVGTLEAAESARQIADLGRGPFAPAGAGLTAAGFVASCAVYLALGWWLRDDRAAIRYGVLTGSVSGVAGGAIRAVLIADGLKQIIGRHAVVPDAFIAVVLVVFVALAAAVSAAGGAALAFAGVRLARVSRTTSGSAARSESTSGVEAASCRPPKAGRSERED